MLREDRNKLNRIEELKGKLFSKSFNTKIEHRERFSDLNVKDVPESWEDSSDKTTDSMSYQERFFMKTSIFKRFFVSALVFFVLTLGYASYVFFAGGNTVSNDNIEISVLGNNFTAGGEELSLVVGITNKNSLALDLVDLVIEYPKSSADFGAGLAGTERLRQSLGTVPAGTVRNENIKLVLFGEQGVVIPLKISIEYRVEGSNGIFVKTRPFEVTINSTPLNLTLEAPSVLSSNQDFTLKIKAALNATRPATKILLKLDYPAGFQFRSASPSPSIGNNVWNLGDLAPGAERNISVSGRMLDAFDGEEKTFHIAGGSQSVSDKSAIDVVFNSLSHAIAIQKPFIDAKLSINDVSQREYSANSSTPIRGTIKWVNNLDTRVSDLEIRAKIYGNALDKRSVKGDQGFYNSSTDTIVWDKNSQRDFAEVDPGDSGSVSFSVSSLAGLSAGEGITSEPVINVDISISGKQVVSGYATTDLTNSDSGVIRIISDVGFAAKALYYSGAFPNTGPIPPKVERETSYTVVWSVSNTTNNISKGVVRSSLPSWVKFVGTVSPAGEDVIFNPSTREITWNIGRVPKGTGITTGSRSVSFQIAFTPSLSQVDTVPVIINEAVLTAHDDFANVEVKTSKPSLRTQLDNDPALPANGGTVAE